MLVAVGQDGAAEVGSSEGARGVLVAPGSQEDEVVTAVHGACSEAGEQARLGPCEVDGLGAETSGKLVGGAGARHGVEGPKDRVGMFDGLILCGMAECGREPLGEKWPSPSPGFLSHHPAMSNQRLAVETVHRVASLPYVWPCPPDAGSARSSGTGSCSSKHALLSEELAEIGISSHHLFVAGALVPSVLADDPEIAAGVGLVEVHECLTVSVPGAGPCLVDVTWDPPLIEAGLPGTRAWDGASDMAVAVGSPIGWWAPDPRNLRSEKEALRARLCGPADRAVRDRVLAAMADRFAAWRR